MKLKLGVNIDHVATLRQVRGTTTYPDPVEAAARCLQGGADSLTVHLREDRRHILDADVFALRSQTPLPLNLEMANYPEIVAIALEVKPDEVCLVPERPEEITTEGGLDAISQMDALRPTVAKLQEAGMRVSLFIEPDPRQLEAAVELGAPVVELHAGIYSNTHGLPQAQELERLAEAARYGHQLGLQINAGHGLNYRNLTPFVKAVPHLHTLNIGQSIVARAVLVGMEQAVREMKDLMT